MSKTKENRDKDAVILRALTFSIGKSSAYTAISVNLTVSSGNQLPRSLEGPGILRQSSVLRTTWFLAWVFLRRRESKSVLQVALHK